MFKILYRKINRQFILVSFFNIDVRVNNDQITLSENIIFKVCETRQVNRMEFKNISK